VAVGKQALDLTKETFKEFFKDNATWKAAALSYFTVFALAPLLVLVLQVASLLFDPAQVRDALTGQFSALMGQDVANQVQTMMNNAERQTASGSGFRLILSIAGLLFGATGAFVSLQDALNSAWEVEPDPKRGGIKNFIFKRFLSLGMVLGIAFLLLVSLAVTAALSAVGDYLFGGSGTVFAEGLNFVLTFAIISLLFAAMFKVLPDAKVEWRDVWVGAIATALLFVAGKFLIGLYIGQSNPGSAFGAAGALAVLLVWIYYAAIILMLGAEFTQAWMKMHGRTIEPEEGAVRVVERKERLGPGEFTPEMADEKDSGSDTGRDRAPAFAAARSHNGTGKDGGHRVEKKDTKTEKKSHDRKNDDVSRVQFEMEETRERMSDTLAALESRVTGVADGVKEKLDVSQLVKEHPWPALATAIVAGVALSATGADEKAAGATVEAAKRGSSAAVDGLRHVGEAAVNRLHGGNDDAANDGAGLDSGNGTVDQPKEPAKNPIVRAVQTQVRELANDMRRESESIGRPT